jgi:osmotically-inducible protein OsmY
MSPNTELDAEVRAALERDPRILDPIDIAVSGDDGVVSLRGTVRSFSQRRAAVEDAKSAAGVDEVIDQLQVRLLEDDAFDDRLRGLVLQRLIDDPDVPSDFIDVKVKDGWVTLKGRITEQSESDAAYETVARTEGVGGITNEIKVASAGY